MKYLGIDYGSKRIGLALAPGGVDVVVPFGVIENQESGIMNQALVDLINQEKIDFVIIGLPLGLDGSENANTKKIRAFANELRVKISVPVEFENEMFSSQAGDRAGAGVSRDEKAAMIILQSYLQRNKEL